MPLSTDSVLLGAWVDVNNDQHLLDVGSGSGIVSLMIAQRNPNCTIEAVEIDYESHQQGLDNIRRSPWADRIYTFHLSFQEFVQQTLIKYDHIVSNPPFYQQDLQSPHPHRTIAKHAHLLSFSELIEGAAAILSDKGKLSVIIPFAEKDYFIRECLKRELFCIRYTSVRSTTQSPFIRSLVTFGKEPQPIEEDSLTLYENNPQEPTEAYRQLTYPFYLKMPHYIPNQYENKAKIDTGYLDKAE